MLVSIVHTRGQQEIASEGTTEIVRELEVEPFLCKTDKRLLSYVINFEIKQKNKLLNPKMSFK